LAEVFETLAKKTKIKVFALYGGVEQDKQIKKLQDGVDILISTPGRMFDLISQGHLRTNRIHTLVLDEADHMLDLGFIKDITDMMRHIPKKRQTLFFSATINPIIKKLAYSIVNNPIKIEISPKDPVAKKVDHYVMYVEMDDKRFFLERLVREEDKAKILVFVRTKVRAERVKKAMDRVGVESITMHGDKAQSDRLNVMEAFKTGKVKLLIATDVSARGIDIPNVDFVVNYDLPDYTENYVHRVGRTGRGDQRGIAYTFCSAGEKDLLDEIQSFLGKKINVMELKGDVYTEVKTFSDMDNLSIDRIIGDLDKLVFNKKKKKKRKK
jgi:ATP-dependent RNA helicase RhlE